MFTTTRKKFKKIFFFLKIKNKLFIIKNDPKICFHYFEKVAKCSVHGIFRDGSDFCPVCKTEKCEKKIGTFSNRKQMVLLTRSFTDFIENFYRPT